MIGLVLIKLASLGENHCMGHHSIVSPLSFKIVASIFSRLDLGK